MNTRRHIKRNTVLGLGLLAALAAGGLLVMSRRSRVADLSAPQPVSAAQRMAAEQPVKSVSPEPRSALQPAEPVPEKIQTLRPALEGSGYESPFSSTNKPLANTTTSEKLYAKLMAAAASGNVRDIAVLLHSGNTASEIEAVRLLARIGGGEALAAALGKLLTVPADDPNYNKFIHAFADCHSAAVADWLTDTLGQAQTEEVRQRVLAILAALRGPEVVDSLAAGLASPMDAMHAKDCAELLAKASDPEQAAILRSLLETEESAAMQTAAARGLASIGSGAACAALIEMGSSSDAAAEAARKALAEVDSSYGQKELFRALVNPSTPRTVLIPILKALEKQPGQITQTVLENVVSSDPDVQAAIDQTLQTIEQKRTPPQPGSALGDAGINGELWF